MPASVQHTPIGFGHRRGRVSRSTHINELVLNCCSTRLHSLPQERDRQLAEKAHAREATAERKRAKMFEAADRARLARERSWQDREKAAEREAAARKVVEDEALRLGTGSSLDYYQPPPVFL